MAKEQPEFTLSLNSNYIALRRHVLNDYPLEAPYFWNARESEGHYAGVRRAEPGKEGGKLVCGIKYNAQENNFRAVGIGGRLLAAPFPALREALTYAHTRALLGIEQEGG